ncbi:hypothetical protein [Streptomyces sp. KL116D]|uniref:hypothetical protein n=1 Tax=Streptomyces sp. KL116D TaxID=3045152 RepID=UPI0035592DEC
MLKNLGRCSAAHPSLITPADIDIMNGDYDARSLASVYGYKDGWGELGTDLAQEITALLTTAGRRPEADRRLSSRTASRTPEPDGRSVSGARKRESVSR